MANFRNILLLSIHIKNNFNPLLHELFHFEQFPLCFALHMLELLAKSMTTKKTSQSGRFYIIVYPFIELITISSSLRIFLRFS